MSSPYNPLTTKAVKEVNEFKKEARRFRDLLERFFDIPSLRSSKTFQIIKELDTVVSKSIAYKTGIAIQN